MGLFSSKKTTKTTNQSTTTPIAPDWIQGPISDAFGRVNELGSADPSSYVAGPNQLQQQAVNNAASLGGAPYWDSAAALTRGSLMRGGPATYGPESLLTGIDNYKNPYLQDVLQTSLRDYDINADRTRAQQTLDMAASNAFGGSGSALTRSMTEGELSRGRANLASGIYANAFNTAASLSNMDAQRRQDASAANAAAFNSYNSQAAAQQLAAGGQMANIASTFGADQRSNASLQSDIGTMFRNIQQEQLKAPLDLASWQTQQYAGLPGNLFVGQHVEGSGKSVEKSSDPLKSIGDITNIAKSVSGFEFKIPKLG
jgi:hypothetical protein